MNFENPSKALEWATIISESKGFCPKEYWKLPYDILVAIQYGSELGLAPLQSIQGIAVINGKPSIYGDLMLGVCKVCPQFEYIHETFDAKTLTATCAAKRRNQPEVVRTFSKENAITAQLWGQPTYKKYPERMLQMRARGFALRDCFADVLKGLIIREEAMDYPVVEKDVTPNLPALEKPAHEVELYTEMATLFKLKNVPSSKVDEWCQRNHVLYAWDLPEESMRKIITYLQSMETNLNGV
jgi:hypothetical protein